jgi:hypothetical protein
MAGLLWITYIHSKKTLEHTMWNCFVDKYKAIINKNTRVDIK